MSGYVLLKSIHSRFVFERRVHVLARKLGALIPSGSMVLDIGCGSGDIARSIMQQDPSVSIQGLEVMPRPDCAIPCRAFDGNTIPQEDRSFDVCLFVDVLHHAPNIDRLLSEAGRISRKYVLIKDHLCEGPVHRGILKLMDWIGNRPYRVRLEYHFLSRQEWRSQFTALHWKERAWDEHVPLYPGPLQLVFGRGLHVVALLEVR